MISVQTQIKGGYVMENYNIYQDIALRTGGDIYIGVLVPSELENQRL